MKHRDIKLLGLSCESQLLVGAPSSQSCYKQESQFKCKSALSRKSIEKTLTGVGGPSGAKVGVSSSKSPLVLRSSQPLLSNPHLPTSSRASMGEGGWSRMLGVHNSWLCRSSINVINPPGSTPSRGFPVVLSRKSSSRPFVERWCFSSCSSGWREAAGLEGSGLEGMGWEINRWGRGVGERQEKEAESRESREGSVEGLKDISGGKNRFYSKTTIAVQRDYFLQKNDWPYLLPAKWCQWYCLHSLVPADKNLHDSKIMTEFIEIKDLFV